MNQVYTKFGGKGKHMEEPTTSRQRCSSSVDPTERRLSKNSRRTVLANSRNFGCSVAQLDPSKADSNPAFAETWLEMKLNEPNMVVQAIKDLIDTGYLDANQEEAKILDFGVTNGEIGELLSNSGFTQVYGQEGCKRRRARSLRKGNYKEIEF